MHKRILRFCSVLSFFIRCLAFREAFVSEVMTNSKYGCPSAIKKVHSVSSEIQCSHHCLQHDECKILNYKAEDGFKKNCEVYLDVDSCSSRIEMNGWGAYVLQRQQSPPKVYKSCKEIYNERPWSATGVYDLESGKHFCYMDDISGATGGWTLALKIDGSKNTFMASSTYWSSKEVYNIENGIKSFYEEEAKFPAFNYVKFEDVCIGIKVGTNIRWLRIPGVNREALVSLFASGTEHSTSLSRSSWKSLMASSSLQYNCNRQGFNVKNPGGTILTRIGYIANQESDCDSCDSFIGMGPAYWPVSCGNYALASTYPDAGGRNTAAMCYVLVR